MYKKEKKNKKKTRSSSHSKKKKIKNPKTENYFPNYESQYHQMYMRSYPGYYPLNNSRMHSSATTHNYYPNPNPYFIPHPNVDRSHHMPMMPGYPMMASMMNQNFFSMEDQKKLDRNYDYSKKIRIKLFRKTIKIQDKTQKEK
jgi:hypothetical protein